MEDVKQTIKQCAISTELNQVQTSQVVLRQTAEVESITTKPEKLSYIGIPWKLTMKSDINECVKQRRGWTSEWQKGEDFMFILCCSLL